MNNALSVFHGNLELMYSGVLIYHTGEPFTVTLPDIPDSPYRLVFTVLDAYQPFDDAMTRITIDPDDEFVLFVNIPNDRSQIIANIELMKIGTSSGHQLYLSYRIFNIQKGGPTLMLNIFKGERI